MTLEPLTIGNIKIKYPIIQGGMGVGISLSGLASAVTLSGGLGVISAAQIGYRDPLFKTNPLEANLKALKEQIILAKEKAKQGPIGVNIMVATAKYEEYVKCAIDAGVDVIISGAGLPIKLPSLVKDTGTKFAPIVSSIKAAKLLLKMWDRKEETTCDMIVVENHLAGGHLGFKPESIEEYSKDDSFDTEFVGIIECVKEYEEKYNRKIPVIYAGGIYTKEDIEHVVSLGASGVQMGTRFVTTYECDADIEFKNAYLKVKKDEIGIVKSPVGMPGRAVTNDFVNRKEREEIKECYKCIGHCDPKTTPYCITKALINSAKGDTSNGLIFCGANAYKCDEIISVDELMHKLVD